jgi:hypothetical protein
LMTSSATTDVIAQVRKVMRRRARERRAVFRASLTALVMVSVGLLAAGCTTKILRPGGETEYLITCSGFGWHTCYGRANNVCPTGYLTELEDGWGLRNDLRISCPGQRATP